MLACINIRMLLCLDWNTLIVGKLSSWIEADSELENVRRNSEAVSSWCYAVPSMSFPGALTLYLSPPPQALVQELNFSAYLGLPVFMIPLNGPNNANLARLLLNHIHTGHHTSNVRQRARGGGARSVG